MMKMDGYKIYIKIKKKKLLSELKRKGRRGEAS